MPIKIVLKQPLSPQEIRERLTFTQAVLVRGARSVGKITFIQPTDEEARMQLLTTSDQWLKRIDGEIYKQRFFTVAHGFEALDQEVLPILLQQQNKLQAAPRVRWLSRKSQNGSGTILIGLSTPEEANRLIRSGLVYNYEIKKVYQAIRIPRCKTCHKPGHRSPECKSAPKGNQPGVKAYFREPQRQQKEISTSIGNDSDGFEPVEYRKRRRVGSIPSESESTRSVGGPVTRSRTLQMDHDSEDELSTITVNLFGRESSDNNESHSNE